MVLDPSPVYAESQFGGFAIGDISDEAQHLESGGDVVHVHASRVCDILERKRFISVIVQIFENNGLPIGVVGHSTEV